MACEYQAECFCVPPRGGCGCRLRYEERRVNRRSQREKADHGRARGAAGISICLSICLLAASASLPAFAQPQPTQAPSTTSATPSAAPSADPGTRRLVPAGTQVPVYSVDKISSATAQVGDIIQISAAQDVVVDDYVVVLKGAGGQAEIASVEKAHGNGGSGKLGIKMDWISAIDGERILLTSSLKSTSQEDRGGGSSTASILSYALLGPLGLFAHNFAHGKDVIIDSSKLLTAFTDASVHVTSTTAAKAPVYAH
jgi:hypothetical protein